MLVKRRVENENSSLVHPRFVSNLNLFLPLSTQDVLKCLFFGHHHSLKYIIGSDDNNMLNLHLMCYVTNI